MAGQARSLQQTLQSGSLAAATTPTREFHDGDTGAEIPTPATVHWGYFDAALAPVLEIDPGDVVVVNSVSGGGEYSPNDPQFTVRPALRAIDAAVRPELGPHHPHRTDRNSRRRAW